MGRRRHGAVMVMSVVGGPLSVSVSGLPATIFATIFPPNCLPANIFATISSPNGLPPIFRHCCVV